MHKALRTWSLSLVSGFNAELPLLKKTSYLHTLLSRKLHAELWVYVGKYPSLQSNLIQRSLFLFLSPFPLLREGMVKNKCFNRSRGAIRDSQLKKKFRNDVNEPVPSGVWGWDCRPLSPVKAAKGGGGALASSPSTFPHPSFPTSVRPLAWFQPLLQLLSRRLQDSNNYSRCSQPRWWSVCILHLPLAPRR